MRIILKILALPLLFALTLLCLAGKLSANLAGYVYSVLLLIVIGCGIFAIVKAQWTNLAILAGMGIGWLFSTLYSCVGSI